MCLCVRVSRVSLYRTRAPGSAAFPAVPVRLKLDTSLSGQVLRAVRRKELKRGGD